MPEVAQVFQEVAGAETIHGLNHLRVAGGVESTVENLCTVTTGEAKEFSTMYPRMIAEARDEGRGDVAETFALALSREAHHLEMFSNALAALETKLNPTVNASRPGLDAMSTGPQQETPAVFEPGLDTLVNAARELDRERWRVASLGRLREVVCGAQDGILSTVALVTSVRWPWRARWPCWWQDWLRRLRGPSRWPPAHSWDHAPSWTCSGAEIAKEARELEENPGEEYAELVVAFQREGKSYEEARAMADEIAQDKDLWLPRWQRRSWESALRRPPALSRTRWSWGCPSSSRPSAHHPPPVPDGVYDHFRVRRRRAGWPLRPRVHQGSAGQQVPGLARTGNLGHRRGLRRNRLRPRRHYPPTVGRVRALAIVYS